MSESREAKVIYGFNVTPVKLSMDLSELELILTLKKSHNIPDNQRNLEKENKVGGVMLPDIKQYY